MAWRKVGRNKGKLVCIDCDAESKIYSIHSPAAPELSLCEQAEQDGWAYDIGFFAMLCGHTTKCPRCRGTHG